MPEEYSTVAIIIRFATRCQAESMVSKISGFVEHGAFRDGLSDAGVDYESADVSLEVVKDG